MKTVFKQRFFSRFDTDKRHTVNIIFIKGDYIYETI